MDTGGFWVIVHGVTKSQTRLSTQIIYHGPDWSSQLQTITKTRSRGRVNFTLLLTWRYSVSSVPIPSTSQGASQNEFFGFNFSLLAADSYCTDTHFLVLHSRSVL